MTESSGSKPGLYIADMQNRERMLHIEPEEIIEDSETTVHTIAQLTLPDGQKIAVHEWNPRHAEHVSSTPIVIASGWMTSAEPYFRLAESLSAMHGKKNSKHKTQGRRVIAFSAPTGVNANHLIEKLGARIPSAELRKIAMLDAVFSAKKIEKAVIVCHSEGAFYSSLYAVERPEQVASLILLDPLGITTADDSIIEKGRIAQRLHSLRSSLALVYKYTIELWAAVFHGIRNGRLKPAMNLLFMEAIPSVLLHPKYTWNSIEAMHNADIRKHITSLQNRGCHVGVVVANDETLFPRSEIEKKLADAGVHPDRFVIISGEHNAALSSIEGYEKVNGILEQLIA